MNRVQRFFFRCCFIAGRALLCIFAVGIVVGIIAKKSIPVMIYVLVVLFALIAAVGRIGLKKILPEES